MLYCEKGTSLLFPPIDKQIQVYNCRVAVVCPAKNKTTQRDTEYKNDCVGPNHNNLETVCIDTNSLETSSTSSSIDCTEISTDQTKEKMLETDDMVPDWEPSLKRGTKINKRGKQNEREYMEYDVKKMYRRRRKGRISRAVQICQNPLCLKSKREGYPSKMISKMVSTRSAFNKRSLISLYRKKKHSEGTEKHEDIKKDKGETCYKGVCTKAAKRKEKDFVCTCVPKKEPGVMCSDNTCSKRFGERTKSSFMRICSKSLQKFRSSRKQNTNKICEQGVCKEASNRKNPDISCTCKDRIKTCSDNTCTENKGYRQRVSWFNQKLPNRIKRKPCQDKVRERVVVQNEKDQTGDPFFEIKVNAIDMCVLNPSEIKDKVLEYGKVKTRRQCVCASHRERERYILKRDACLGGACQKAVRNKKTDFTCKCLKHKIWTCENTTCNKALTLESDENYFCGTENHPKQNKTNNNRPLFEVQVDNDNMCIINRQEMLHNLDDIHRQKKKMCSSGICRDKSKDRNTHINCKCHKMIADHCTELTCDGDGINTPCCKCEKHNRKMVRSTFDTAALKNIKSKISLFYARVCSKSDNWTNRNKEKKARTCRRCNLIIRTQSENVHRRDGLKIEIRKPKKERVEARSEAINDCCPCSSDETSEKEDDINMKPKSNKKVRSKKNKKVLKSPNNAEVAKSNAKPSKPRQIIAKKVTQIKSDKTTIEEKPVAEIENKVHKRKGLVIPIPSSKGETISEKPVSKKKPVQKATCLCHHRCDCNLELQKRRMKNKENKYTKKSNKHKKRQKKKKDDSSDKKWAQQSREKRKQFAKEKKRMDKLAKERNKKQMKEEREVMKLLESEGGARRSNCFIEILVAIFSAGVSLIGGILYGIFHLITKPKRSLMYIEERLDDKAGTWIMIKRSLMSAWRIRKLKICKCFNNSEKMSILSDAFKEGPLYQTFVDKGKTAKEQKAFEIESKARKKRVDKRRDAALFGCRHMLLNTLRRTPCMWVYHVCPEFYPQCLSMLTLFRQFWHMTLFALALACWTPFIVLCEATRGLCCCLLCTG